MAIELSALNMIDINDFISNDALIQDDQKDVDYSSVVLGVRACSEMNNLSSIVVDFDNKKAIYLSDSLIYLDEATFIDLKSQNSIPYWFLLDEETALKLSQVRKVYSRLKCMLSEDEYRRHVCIMDYPITIRGKKLFINSRFTPLVFGPDRRISLGLYTYVPSSKRELSLLVITSSGRRWFYDFLGRTFIRFDVDFEFTDSEKKILKRAMKGMSNEEMAEDLFLSVNTIKSHKMHIFRKLGVSTIAEALVLVSNYSLL